jgi:Uracil phosphoribosyltransferase
LKVSPAAIFPAYRFNVETGSLIEDTEIIMAAPSCDTDAAILSHPAPSKYQNVIILPQTNQLIALLTICRDKNTSRADFIFYANRIIRLLVEEGVSTPVLCLGLLSM